MEVEVRIKENWFTAQPQQQAKAITVFMTILLFFSGFYFLQNTFHFQEIMPASPDSVFVQHEYWRLWTTLFAHADVSHLLNNALLFIPLTYLLTAYFSIYFFPLLGIFFGGLINYGVLLSMPHHTQLIGISGVVYWMGGAWFTLFLLIDRRRRLRYQFAHVLFLILMIFIPETYWPHISYKSHFFGFIGGIACAYFLYFINRKTYKTAEVLEYIFDDTDDEMEFESEPQKQ